MSWWMKYLIVVIMLPQRRFNKILSYEKKMLHWFFTCNRPLILNTTCFFYNVQNILSLSSILEIRELWSLCLQIVFYMFILTPYKMYRKSDRMSWNIYKFAKPILQIIYYVINLFEIHLIIHFPQQLYLPLLTRLSHLYNQVLVTAIELWCFGISSNRYVSSTKHRHKLDYIREL